MFDNHDRITYTVHIGTVTFEWNISKSHSNLSKHGVTFENAIYAFTDPHAIIISDPEHSIDEDRFVLIGTNSEAKEYGGKLN